MRQDRPCPPDRGLPRVPLPQPVRAPAEDVPVVELAQVTLVHEGAQQVVDGGERQPQGVGEPLGGRGPLTGTDGIEQMQRTPYGTDQRRSRRLTHRGTSGGDDGASASE